MKCPHVQYMGLWEVPSEGSSCAVHGVRGGAQ